MSIHKHHRTLIGVISLSLSLVAAIGAVVLAIDMDIDAGNAEGAAKVQPNAQLDTAPTARNATPSQNGFWAYKDDEGNFVPRPPDAPAPAPLKRDAAEIRQRPDGTVELDTSNIRAYTSAAVNPDGTITTQCERVMVDADGITHAGDCGDSCVHGSDADNEESAR